MRRVLRTSPVSSLPLFAAGPGWLPPPPPRETEQSRQIKRVRGKIGPLVMDFLRARGVGATFHAAELHDFVGDQVAPASADRILRDLRASGDCDYEVRNRRASEYQITALK